MKLIKNIIFILVAFCLVTPSHARSYKCIKKPTGCKPISGQSNYSIDWAISCNNDMLVLAGVAVCASTRGVNMGDVLNDNPERNNGDFASTADNKYCWCKMTTPGNSSWLYGYAPPSGYTPTAEFCAINCGRFCLAAAGGPDGSVSDAIRAALLDSMIAD